ncbi:hypothetical protein [Hoylesella loescheii]|jgi:hypothetical protein|uniref:hypothetical protein n=1 Tax=Hoylesella loescheii TaxID=840 RepID=UPI0028EA34A2|nr:hypothetical protein [Hoylesella loescheii]
MKKPSAYCGTQGFTERQAMFCTSTFCGVNGFRGGFFVCVYFFNITAKGMSTEAVDEKKRCPMKSDKPSFTASLCATKGLVL